MTVIILLVLFSFCTIIIINTLRYKSRQMEITGSLVPNIDQRSAIYKLSQAVKIQTISYENKEKVTPNAFKSFHEFLQGSFPSIHNNLNLNKINNYSLLYKWKGSNESLEPVLFLAHQDVVPVEPQTVDMWTQEPFGGIVEDGFIWGRGTLDDKSCLIAVMEAVEHLINTGFEPVRTVYLAFGHDEEIGGQDGAAKIAEYLHEQGVKLSFVIDEGMSIIDKEVSPAKRKTALIGLSEKGYVTLKIQANGKSGHSSMPHADTAIGSLAKAIRKLDKNPMAERFCEPAEKMFQFLGPEMPFIKKVLFANLWLFKNIIKSQFKKANTTNALIRTTCAPTIIKGGEKENVVPSSAYVLFNYRILPGDTISSVVSHAKKIIDDPAVAVTIKKGSFDTDPSPISSISSFGFEIISQTIKEVFEDIIIAPGLVFGATDSRHFASVSKNIYHFVPYNLGKEDTDRIHGIDERIAIENYINLIQFYARLIRNCDIRA